ncbi:DNA-binding response regulator, OmpR family, contains REC and winged-helix (wHTH) domain [Lutimaribacter pacificus]|uniref:DNA-binding response regulator, OmpR family, contains REC and winged-helix (WHTH) domain n=1 Tax=Lutimaribacter pacificus TaxID=391948 RepID=A0A1H0GFL3_9RHOB|nr:response regulator transcription factor [Lutimaribacter pacificus]SDO05634.1 DNA-binding response regulator, OmpR family, contains REC and winged-helix (wHTH) domain [Lutimaribacter pacificus]SHJ87769.1 DNA-binding response regulator, OmpR family, contains REC and winged-helix (wHTH) domain [Lutimaribacter pacificus]
MRILLAEDDHPLADVLARRLAEAGHAVDVFPSVADAEAAWSVAVYDLAIIDVMLEDGDGRTLIKTIRAAGLTTPTLILSARDEIGDRVTGLDAGADDYLVKPFATDELLARLRALGRRTGEPAAPEFQIGNLVYTPQTATLIVADRPVQLTAREHAALDRLLRAGGRITPKRRMGEYLYAFHHDWSDNAVEAVIHRLRKKLSGAGATVELKALRGLGYVLIEAPE